MLPNEKIAWQIKLAGVIQTEFPRADVAFVHDACRDAVAKFSQSLEAGKIRGGSEVHFTWLYVAARRALVRKLAMQGAEQIAIKNAAPVLAAKLERCLATGLSVFWNVAAEVLDRLDDPDYPHIRLEGLAELFTPIGWMPSFVQVVTRLTPNSRHREIALRVLNGERTVNIAEDLGVSESRISDVKHTVVTQLTTSEEFRQLLRAVARGDDPRDPEGPGPRPGQDAAQPSSGTIAADHRRDVGDERSSGASGSALAPCDPPTARATKPEDDVKEAWCIEEDVKAAWCIEVNVLLNFDYIRAIDEGGVDRSQSDDALQISVHDTGEPAQKLGTDNFVVYVSGNKKFASAVHVAEKDQRMGGLGGGEPYLILEDLVSAIGILTDWGAPGDLSEGFIVRLNEADVCETYVWNSLHISCPFDTGASMRALRWMGHGAVWLDRHRWPDVDLDTGQRRAQSDFEAFDEGRRLVMDYDEDQRHAPCDLDTLDGDCWPEVDRDSPTYLDATLNEPAGDRLVNVVPGIALSMNPRADHPLQLVPLDIIGNFTDDVPGMTVGVNHPLLC
jgi:hypothetical protein